MASKKMSLSNDPISMVTKEMVTREMETKRVVTGGMIWTVAKIMKGLTPMTDIERGGHINF
jgi:hypothetical protein